MTEEQKITATKEGFQRMKNEMEKMKTISKQAEIKGEEINEQMIRLIKTREMKNVGTKLTEIWDDELKRRKSRINKDWELKERFLSALEHSNGDGDDDENNIVEEQRSTEATTRQKKTQKQPNNQQNRPYMNQQPPHKRMYEPPQYQNQPQGLRRQETYANVTRATPTQINQPQYNENHPRNTQGFQKRSPLLPTPPGPRSRPNSTQDTQKINRFQIGKRFPRPTPPGYNQGPINKWPQQTDRQGYQNNMPNRLNNNKHWDNEEYKQRFSQTRSRVTNNNGNFL